MSGNNGNNGSIRDQLQFSIRWLMRATIVVYLVLAALGIFVWLDGTHRRQDLEQLATSTNSALCTFVTDLERRVESSREFLVENPDGIPGLPAEVIQQGIDNQERTIDALSNLECKS